MGFEVLVSVREDGAPAERLERAGELLRDELLELEVDSVRRLVAGEAPPGTRGVDLGAVGGLLVSLPNTPAMLSAVIDTIRNWLRRPATGSVERSVRIQIDGDVLELSHATSEQQELLIEDWLRRRGDGTAGDRTGAGDGTAVGKAGGGGDGGGGA